MRVVATVTMLAHALATALLFILSIYVFTPSLWRAIMAIDDYDHEYGLAVVAARAFFSHLPSAAGAPELSRADNC